MTLLLKQAVEPSYEGIRSLRQQLAKALDGFSIDTAQANPILICLSEITTNFVEHSLNGTQIEMQLSVRGQNLQLRITEVAGTHKQAILQEWLDEPPEDPFADSLNNLRSGGRGLWIIHQNCEAAKVIISTQEMGENDTECWRNGFELQWPMTTQSLKPQVLVVEDGESQNALFCAYLKDNYNPIAVFSANEAIAVLAQRHIDIVLCDLQMPQKNGLQLRQTLSENTRHASIPFILTSAHEHENISDCIRLGIDDFLPKPLKKEALNACVKRVLTRNQQLKKDVALKIQNGIHASLQPQIPKQLKHWRAALCNQSNAQGGGDLLVWEQKDEHCLIIVIDVMGHDEAAKFFSHAYLGYIRGFLSAHTQLPAPAYFLNQLSHSLNTDHLLSSSLCTCCVIRLGPKGVVEVASAGHPLPWLIDGLNTREVGNGGTLPGLQADIDYTSATYTLTGTQRLAVFTDGLLDERGKTYDGGKALQRALAQAQDSDLEDSVKKVFKLALDLQQGPLDDALLLLVAPHET